MYSLQVKGALALFCVVVAACPLFASAATLGADQSAPPLKCERSLLSVLVIDDSQNMPPWAADRLREYRLPLPATGVRIEVEQTGCLTVLDGDPVFAAIAGAAQPDAILRVRFNQLKRSEKSLGQKAGSAVGRYIGAYLGDGGEEIPVLRTAEMSLDVICVRSRRAVKQFAAQATAADSASADDNQATVNEASSRLARDAVQYLMERPDLCQLPRT